MVLAGFLSLRARLPSIGVLRGALAKGIGPSSSLLAPPAGHQTPWTDCIKRPVPVVGQHVSPGTGVGRDPQVAGLVLTSNQIQSRRKTFNFGFRQPGGFGPRLPPLWITVSTHLDLS